jgi:ParB-like chromosome segregation protein Spo0J
MNPRRTTKNPGKNPGKNPRKPVEIPIRGIQIGKRHRRDMGDIEGLAASIRDIGLLHPIVITPGFRLIAGERRIRAFESLGRETIPRPWREG